MFHSFSNSLQVRTKLPELMLDVELFFASGLASGIFNNHNLSSVLNDLKDSENGFRIIEFLPSELAGIFGNSIQNKIQINQNMTRHSNSTSLTVEEVRRLYIFHEIGHKILNILSRESVMNDFINTIDSVLQSKGLSNTDLNYREYVKDGFWLLEECLAQELAEYLTYYSSQKQRPQFENRMDLGCIVSTNHDYYGIFQVPTIHLGRTIRGCSKVNSSNEEILLNMIKKALNSNFVLELISEYNQGDAQLYYDLFLTLRAMGMVKIQKYSSFGMGNFLNVNMQSCLTAIEKITTRNRDYREYPPNGYPHIDFDSYKVPSTTSFGFFDRR